MAAAGSPYVHARPFRGRLNAGFFTLAGGYLEWLFRAHKPQVMDGLGGRVLEVGPGVGANLRYYRPGTELVAVEPNLRMHPGLRRRAARAQVHLTLLSTGAEAIDVADEGVDDVVSTLVLCTVADPRQAVREIGRVLRPGGRFRFIEHVAAPAGSPARAIQRVVRRPWQWAFEGCRVDQHTGQLIDAGPFRVVTCESFRLRSPLLPANHCVAGIAIR